MPFQTRKSALILLAPVLAAACNMPSPFKVAEKSSRPGKEATLDPPNQYPGWAYDQPSYQKPEDELKPEPKAKPGDPLHYFTREKAVMVRQPTGYTPEEIPRVAIWWTDNNGFHWQKAGYFGREQSYFPFEVEEDGDYGIRFVGPGQEQASAAPAFPERVYHVDTTLPLVEVTIEPEKTWYDAGQNIAISWRSDDYHLIETPVDVVALLDYTADESKPIEIQKGLTREGSITYQIPQEAIDHEIRFRVDAMDRAGNLGIAYSHALQVVSEPMDQTDAATKQAGRDTTEKIDATRKAVDAVAFKADRQVSGNSHGANDVDAASHPESGGVSSPGSERDAANADASELASAQNGDTRETDSASMGMPDSIATGAAYGLTLLDGARDDLTHGNQLLIPLPATVESNAGNQKWALARPWQSLARTLATEIKTVWALPRARFLEMNPLLKGLFLADTSTRPVAEPANGERHLAELPQEKADDNPSP